MDKISILSMKKEALSAYIKELGQPAFRAKQIFDWLHNKRVSNFDQMANLPKTLIQQLEEKCFIDILQVEKKQFSKDGTIKYLLKLTDGNCIETVLLNNKERYTICVSTQVGCRMGCKFCASTKNGLVRSLTSGEIAAQIYTVQAENEARISNIVLMGIGEPLDNFDNVVDFLSIISDDDGINIGMRSITLSTCGLIPQIERLALLHLGITLSISLHAPNDTLRSSMMPVNDSFKVGQLITTCRNYQRITGRRVTFEYSMVKGVNDTDRIAFELANLIKGMGAHVNLIPINPVDGTPYSATDAKNVSRFQDKLTEFGVNSTVRKRLGQDISAACGQLRHEEQN